MTRTATRRNAQRDSGLRNIRDFIPAVLAGLLLAKFFRAQRPRLVRS